MRIIGLVNEALDPQSRGYRPSRVRLSTLVSEGHDPREWSQLARVLAAGKICASITHRSTPTIYPWERGAPMPEYTPTYHDQLAEELKTEFTEFTTRLPYLESPPKDRQSVYGFLSLPDEFRQMAVAIVAESEALQAVQ